jgi:transposase
MSGQLLDPPLRLSRTVSGPEPGFAEVRVTEPVAISPPRLPSSIQDAPGRIGIESPSGVRLSVDATADADALGCVLSVLSR